MEEAMVNNLSMVIGETSWKEQVAKATGNEEISGYSHYMFLKNGKEVNTVRELVNSSDKDFTISSSAIEVEDALFALVNAASIGMEVFLLIALIGTTLIIGLIAFASYSEDIKELAILLCLGARRDDLVSIYLFESTIVGLVGTALSFVLVLLFQNPINYLIFRLTALPNLIDIPFQQFYGRPFLFPLLIAVSTMLICLISTCLPLIFAKKISLSEELRSND
jgi:ABC-type antimicrobial peptide transport system permease subunit